MKTFYMKLFVFLFFALTVLGASSQNKKMPITSNSAKAVSFYQQAAAAIENADFATAIDLLKKALKEDPNFFLSQYQLANVSTYINRPDEYRKYTDMAKNNQSKLSEAELLLKSALLKRDADSKADNLDVWKKLVEMYPNDPEPYYYWGTSLSMRDDFNGALDIYKKVLEFTDQPGPVYNMMGYSYMYMKDFANAEKFFDRYIQIAPNHPNPYDSKGDYYMEIKDYENAYKSYMESYDQNANWGYEKAQKAKKLMEMTKSGVIDAKNLQGTWKLVDGWWINEKGDKIRFKEGNSFNQIKVWSGNHFICVGKYKDGDQIEDNFACGTFSLDGKKYAEDIQYHKSKPNIGNKVNMMMEIKGDTLIQVWPANDSGKVDQNKSSGEKYVRIK